MKAGARSCLRDLAHRHIEVTLQLLLQRRILFEFMEKRWRGYAPCGTCSQNHSMKWRGFDSQHEGNSEHVFIADQSHSQTCTAIDGRHQGNEAPGRKVNVRDKFSGAVKHFGKNQFNLFTIGEQLFATLVGEGSQKTIGNVTAFCRLFVSARISD
jgi:hypothetical protein